MYYQHMFWHRYCSWSSYTWCDATIIRAFGRVEGSMQYILKAWPTIIELASVYKRLGN